MRIEIVAFGGFDALDVVAPWEVFARAATIAPDLEVALVRADGPPLVSAANGLQLHVADELGTPDALFVPGGSWVDGHDTGVPHEIRRGTLPRIIADLSTSVRWTASVCTGALLLGAAGILRNRNATTNPA
uniref:DJ-1/PfpI family protein n=2 Tax=Mycobacteriaceae TaxID=1762 RepID=UPI0021F29A48